MADSSYGAMVVRDAQMGDVNGNGESMALSLGVNGDASTTTELLTGILSGVEKIAEVVTAMWQGDAADRTAEDIEGADVAPSPGAEDDEGGGGFFEGAKRMAGKPSVKFALLLGGLALLMKFADKLIPILAPILKFIKEEVWPRAVKVFQTVLDSAVWLFNNVLKPVAIWIKDNVFSNAIDYFKDVLDSMVVLWNDLTERFSVLFSDDATWLEKITAFLGIFKDLGAYFVKVFDSLATNILEMFGFDFAPYDSVGAWIVGKVKGMFTAIKDWFSETGTWIMEGATGIWDWITTKISNAWTGLTTWFSETGTFLLDGATGIWDWITSKVHAGVAGITTWFSETGTFLLEGATGIVGWITDKLTAPFKFLTDLFSWPENPKEFATKLIDIVLIPYNLIIKFLGGIFGWDSEKLEDFSLGKLVIGAFDKAWTWISGIFSWGADDEIDQDKDGEKMSLAGLALGALDKVWTWIKEKFTFDIPTMKLPKLPSIEGMINSIIGAMLPDPGSWLYDWIPGGDALEEMAVKARMANEVDTSMDVGETDMTGAGSTGAKETINEYKQLKAQEGPPGQSGMNINTIDSSSPTTVNNENIQVIALESEHNDPVQEAFKPKGRMGLYNR